MKNSKQEPTPIDWCEEPDVSVERHWVKDETGEVRQETLVNVNGVLFTFEDAKEIGVVG